MVSEKKLAANRLNAKKSTGPKTPEGKSRSSRNASTHGIFCRDLVIDGESEQEFLEFRDDFLRSLSPQDMMELALVDRIVAAHWRLRRAAAAEKHVYAVTIKGRLDITIGRTLAAEMSYNNSQIVNISRYEQRLSNEARRSLRDLERLRASRDDRGELPKSPYLVEDEIEEISIVKNEPKSAEPQWRNPERDTGLQPMRKAPEIENCSPELQSRAPAGKVACDGG